jgi:hypothetical protein
MLNTQRRFCWGVGLQTKMAALNEQVAFSSETDMNYYLEAA